MEYINALRVTALTIEGEAARNEAVGAQYARRAAVALVTNDLHGAMWAADIAAYAYSRADRLNTGHPPQVYPLRAGQR